MSEHPLRFERGAAEGLKPYVRVRDDLWALVKRALFYDLVDLGTTERRRDEDLVRRALERRRSFRCVRRARSRGFERSRRFSISRRTTCARWRGASSPRRSPPSV